MSIVQGAYNALTLPLSGVAALACLASERGRARLWERFGAWGTLPSECLWFHGASAGEVRGLLPVLEHPRVRECAIPRLLTALSKTGLDVVGGRADEMRLLPFDNALWLRRALGDTSVRCFVFGETEIWPQLLHRLAKRGVPRCLVNARISEAVFRRYKTWDVVFRPHFEQLTMVAASESRSAERFAQLGVPESRISITGNAKYDLTPPPVSVAALRERYFPGSQGVLTLGSIRPGEELYWYSALQRARVEGLACDVVVAPRHKEKFDFFADALERLGLPYQRWSGFAAERWFPGTPRVLVLDTFGELLPFYAIATAAFIGATLIEIGGHNPLEAAMFGVPVILGPYRRTIEEICLQLHEAGGLISVSSSSECFEVLKEIAHDPSTFREKGVCAQRVATANRGATERLVERLLPFMEARA